MVTLCRCVDWETTLLVRHTHTRRNSVLANLPRPVCDGGAGVFLVGDKHDVLAGQVARRLTLRLSLLHCFRISTSTPAVSNRAGVFLARATEQAATSAPLLVGRPLPAAVAYRRQRAAAGLCPF